MQMLELQCKLLKLYVQCIKDIIRHFNILFENTWAVLITIVAIIIPTEMINNCPSICFYKAIFKKECIGCGMTRAFVSFFHFDFTIAYEYNKLSIVVVPLVIIVGLKQMIELIKIFLKNKDKYHV